jgi:hypothetical protein
MAERDRILPMAVGDVRKEEPLWKGDGMTKRGAMAAITYMTCAGSFLKSLLSSQF